MSRLDADIARLRARGYAWPVPWAAVEDMARRETCVLAAYRCPAGVWTCGWGETDGITPTTRWDDDKADLALFEAVCAYASRVETLLTRSTLAHELGAMLSLAYNIGLGAFAKSTVLRKHNEGDTEGAAAAFALWNKIRNPRTGLREVSRGLTARRAAECARYLGADEPMPQAVSGRWGA